MNELQITLLIIAVIFLAGLYGLHLKRKKEEKHPPSHAPEPASQSDSLLHADSQEPSTEQPVLKEENGRLVLELEEDDAFEPAHGASVEGVQTNFGYPEKLPENELRVGEEAANREPQLFAIMVIGTHTYTWNDIRTSLLALGMVYDETEQIFVRKNERGKTYLRAANALDPGTFPAPAEEDESFATPGIALILQLPTCIHAPAAMDQMIKDARKLSQRLRAHLYNMERVRINESDLKKMRDAALDYVSVPLK